jgi:hypothetical protein
MYALRHPVLPQTTTTADGEDAEAVRYQEALRQAQALPSRADNLATLSALFPAPSYPGLAFACAAACLPLLRAQNTEVARSVLSVLRAALPHVLEPRINRSGSETGNALLEVEKGRMQHLLDRLEQVRKCVVVVVFVLSYILR